MKKPSTSKPRRILLALIALAGHGGIGAQMQTPADVLKAYELMRKGPAGQAPSAACSLPTRQEAAAALGRAMKAGEIAVQGSACHWEAESGDGDARVQIVSANLWNPPTRARGFRRLEGLGVDAYVEPQDDGWAAFARTGAADAGGRLVSVSIHPDSQEAAVTALLKTVLARMKR